MDPDISDVEKFQNDLVNPEYEQELSDTDTEQFDEFLNEDDEFPEIACFTSRFQIKNIIHSSMPVEYPSTSPEGIATIFHVEDWTDPSHTWKNIQYSMGGGGVHLIKSSPYFGNIPISKVERDCMGIKVCHFTDPSLINIEHNEVDVESPLWKKITENQDSQLSQNVFQWFIGCSKYNISDQWHRYVKIDYESVDIALLRDLFLRKAEIQEQLPYCTTLLHRSSKRKKCDYIHNLSTGDINRGEIVQKLCPVKFYKFTPKDLKGCPFITLVCVGIHNHLPPSPKKIPADIKANLQILINQAINNLIKAFFKSEALSDIHQSLNSVDKLRILVAKAYKNLHPYGQGILGIFYAVKNNHQELKNYIQRIVMSFCRIYTNVSSANDYKNLFSTLFNVIQELTNKTLCIYHIHGKGWECILGDLDSGNLYNKHFSKEIYNLAKSIINAPSQELVKSILNEIENSNEPEHHIWRKYGNNTNMAESAHALINKEGKQLKLIGKRYDERLLKIKDTHDNSDKIVVEIKSNTDEASEIRMDNMSTSIELQKRKMALLERQLKLRKETAEVEALKLQNQQLKINLGLV
ncbi:15566_t:CDS:10 [Cetraspora pellucida]|uniref:15566_t:CDS:1 n=1 Tax=Cetraspora pellucida TaxID=1433469 RepID=A0A9N9NM39_9GLOM|nr:15566_t:CDS:10 [Cetraspora pellucida]